MARSSTRDVGSARQKEVKPPAEKAPKPLRRQVQPSRKQPSLRRAHRH